MRKELVAGLTLVLMAGLVHPGHADTKPASPNPASVGMGYSMLSALLRSLDKCKWPSFSDRDVRLVTYGRA